MQNCICETVLEFFLLLLHFCCDILRSTKEKLARKSPQDTPGTGISRNESSSNAMQPFNLLQLPLAHQCTVIQEHTAAQTQGQYRHRAAVSTVTLRRLCSNHKSSNSNKSNPNNNLFNLPLKTLKQKQILPCKV